MLGAVVAASATIVPLLIGIAGFEALVIFLNLGPLWKDQAAKWRLSFGGLLSFAAVLGLLIHWTAFRFFHLLLPRDRTAIYWVPLGSVCFATLAAIPLPAHVSRISRRALTTALAVLGCYFLLCMRLTYFKEWKWDLDSDKIYSVLAHYNHACGVKDIAANWRFDAPLNFYRTVSRRETIAEFAPITNYPAGKRIYVLYEPEDRAFAKQHSLKAVYTGESGAMVAINPAAAVPPGETACETELPPVGIRW